MLKNYNNNNKKMNDNEEVIAVCGCQSAATVIIMKFYAKISGGIFSAMIYEP